MEVQDYSEKSFAVFGPETKTHKEKLKELGGKFNASLKCGPGWIFPMARKKDVVAFIGGGEEEVKSKVVPSYSASTAGASQSANIVAVFKAEIEKKNFQERIQLLSLLTGIASNTPILTGKEPAVSKSSPSKNVLSKKESPKVKSALDSEDSDEEEDEDAFRPSFLTKKKN